MRAISKPAIFFALLTTAAAQDLKPLTSTEAQEWLKKFEGNWTTLSKTANGNISHRGTMASRSIGKHWTTNEFRVDMGGFSFHAHQTLGFDAKKKVFTATWIDNAFAFKWDYEGKLDKSNKQLVFEAEGPNMAIAGTMAKYRDIYTFKDKETIVTTSQQFGDDDKWTTFMTGEMKRVPSDAKANILPILMFDGKAEEAMKFYISIFPNSKIVAATKYADGENGKAGSIKHATFQISGARMMCIDSPTKHDFSFTPSVSLFVACESEKHIESMFSKLSKDGDVLMPLADYGFSTRFGWVTDRFGVSWQLNFGELK